MSGSVAGLEANDHVMPNEKKDRGLDEDFLHLSSDSEVYTKLAVSLDGKLYDCSFEVQPVSFGDIIVNVGKQCKVSPRHLFSRTLYCSGCGRCLSKEEEEFQVVPSNCCRARSLKLMDRRVKCKAVH